jgi:hypothetical protein
VSQLPVDIAEAIRGCSSISVVAFDISLSREFPLIQPGDKDNASDQRLRYSRAAEMVTRIN